MSGKLSKVRNGSIKLPGEILEAADLKDGDSLYVHADAQRGIRLGPTRVFESKEAFIASLESRDDGDE